MATIRERAANFYGHGPLHLLAFLASFALAGYASQMLFAHMSVRVAVWFVGAAVGHDLLLLPLYGLANSSLTSIWRLAPRAESVPWLNFARFPAAISALLFLIYLPEITRQRTAQLRDSGLSNHPYFDHWLLVTGALFAISAVCYAVRLGQVTRRSRRSASNAVLRRRTN